MIPGIVTISCSHAIVAKDNFFHVHCWAKPCHNNRGPFVTKQMKDAFSQAAASQAVQDSIDIYVETLLSGFRYQLKLLFSLDQAITNECLNAIVKKLPFMKGCNPHEVIIDTCRNILLWHPFFIPTILSINDVKTRRTTLTMNFAILPFYEAFIRELKKRLSVHDVQKLDLNDALNTVTIILSHINLLTDTVSDTEKNKVYNFFFSWLSIKDHNLQVMLEPLCTASRDITKPLFIQAANKLYKGIVAILQEFKRI
jgi:hypothetical protein